MRPYAVLALVGATLIVLVLANGSRYESDSAVARQVEALAYGRSQHGLFVHAGGEIWYQPLAVYPSAALISAGVPIPLALTLPSLLAALIVVWLTYTFARRLQLSQTAAALTAGLLLVTPGFVEHSRAPGGAMIMAATVLAWCVAVLDYITHGKRRVLVAGAGALALAAYAHPAGVLAVPAFFCLAIVTLRRHGQRGAVILRVLIALVVMLAPIAAWLLMHPNAYPDTFGRWAIHAAHVRNPIDGIIAVTRWHVVARRVSEYWNYFNPTFLFGSGELFAWWAVVLIAPGVWSVMFTQRSSRVTTLVVAAALVVPVSAVMLDGARDAAAVLTLAPLGAVLAGVGLQAAGTHAFTELTRLRK
jgi:4-amino-4-deoxy-L-arabinose transferase-like glycosyltransferase